MGETVPASSASRAARKTLISTLFTLLLFVRPAMADDSLVKGYKGIPWGTPCSDAVAALAQKGSTFRDAEKKGSPIRVPSAVDEFLDQCGSPANLEPNVQVNGNADDLDVSIICRAEKLVAVELSSKDEDGIRALRKAAGKLGPMRSAGLGGVVESKTSRLAPRVDAVRFYTRTANFDGYSEVEYIVMSKSEFTELQHSYRECARNEKEEAHRDQRQSRKAKEAVIE
jgi:hypothetical protein